MQPSWLAQKHMFCAESGRIVVPFVAMHIRSEAASACATNLHLEINTPHGTLGTWRAKPFTAAHTHPGGHI